MSKFTVRCTKTCDGRFINGKIYSVEENGALKDEFGDNGYNCSTESFEAWHKACKWYRYDFELVTAYELHITCNDGKTTNAIYKVNGKIEKRTQAVCAPSDEFYFDVGARTAFERMFPRAAGSDESTSQPTQPAQDKPKFIEPYAEPEQPKLTVTRQMLVELGACHGGLSAFDRLFPSGKTDFDTASKTADKDTDCVDNYYGCWLRDRKDRIAAMQNEQPKEPIKLYCVKDRTNFVGSVTRGKIYEFVNGEGLTYDNGEKSVNKSTYSEWARVTSETSQCLVPLVSRPAKVGEWVLIIEGRADGVIGIVESITNNGYPCVKHRDVWGGMFADENGMERTIFNHSQYLVLDNYHPEPEKVEPTYLNMRVVCIDNGTCGISLIVGKPYTVENGKFVDELERVIPHFETPFTSLEDMNAKCAKHSGAKFIEYRGE